MADSPPPPEPERVFEIPPWIGLNKDKFVRNVPAVAVVVIRVRFSSLYVVK